MYSAYPFLIEIKKTNCCVLEHKSRFLHFPDNLFKFPDVVIMRGRPEVASVGSSGPVCVEGCPVSCLHIAFIKVSWSENASDTVSNQVGVSDQTYMI